jgi:hypothetical protein
MWTSWAPTLGAAWWPRSSALSVPCTVIVSPPGAAGSKCTVTLRWLATGWPPLRAGSNVQDSTLAIARSSNSGLGCEITRGLTGDPPASTSTWTSTSVGFCRALGTSGKIGGLWCVIRGGSSVDGDDDGGDFDGEGGGGAPVSGGAAEAGVSGTPASAGCACTKRGKARRNSIR